MRTLLTVKMTDPKPQVAHQSELLSTARLEAAADQAIAACGGDAREAVKALLIANEFLEREMEERVSRGYVRGVKHGRFNTYSG
jgi:Cdc6-like AAA superfamily ATPase